MMPGQYAYKHNVRRRHEGESDGKSARASDIGMGSHTCDTPRSDSRNGLGKDV